MMCKSRRPNNFTSKSRKGFTLVELLVVIAIISILAGLLLPVLESAIDTARTVDCLSNMRQSLLSLSLYTDDNKGWTPHGDGVPLGQWLALMQGGYAPASNPDYISVESCPMLFCSILPIHPGYIPNRPTPFAIRRYPSAETCYQLGPTIRSMNPANPATGISEISFAPSQFFIWGDGCNSTGSMPGAVIYPTAGWTINLRHAKGSGTAAFADGHANTVIPESLVADYGQNYWFTGLGTMRFE